MRYIINAEIDDAPAVLAMMQEQAHNFDRRSERLGWGWTWSIPNGKRFFVRQIKGGLSASPAKPRP